MLNSKIDKMSKKERVIATMNRQETDRVPVYDMLLSDAAIEYFSGVYPPFGEEGIKAKCKATGKMLDMTRAVYYGPRAPQKWTDADGFVRCKDDRYMNAGIIKRPFDDEEGAKSWIDKAVRRIKADLANFDIKNYPENSRERFIELQSYIGDDTVVCYECETGLDEIRANLGFELFSYILYSEAGLISEYIELYTKREVLKTHAIADKTLTPCAMVAGDIAMKGGLLHSPEWLRKEFIPNLKKLIDAWHEHEIKCLFHSDGYIMKIMPDLIEAGIDGLNPIEIAAGMDLKEVKKLYGDKIFITGGIDVSELLHNGTPEKVRAASIEAIEAASPGYFIGSTTELDNGSKLENIIAMLEVAWRI